MTERAAADAVAGPRGAAPAAGAVELRVDHVAVLRGDTRILDDVTVATSARRLAVIGRNGSGKSTFARLLNGLIEPDEGAVTVDGLDTVADGKRVRRRVGFVFTHPDAQIVMPTVAEDVAFSLRGRGLARAEIAERVARLLAEYGLEDRADAPAHELSGGQKQLLALCSVLVTEPGILVADEPTTLLDAANTRRITELLLGLPQQLVVVTHDLALAARCDEALLFHDARLVAHGEPGEVVARYERDYC